MREVLETTMTNALAPLPYHLAIAARLESLEPRGWGVFATAVRQEPGTAAGDPTSETDLDGDGLEQQLLRHAYRMEAASHPRVHAAASRAAEALDLTVPVSIYQLESMEGANAALAFRRDEAVIALSGNLLALLTDEELVACFGHELAHHRLWTAEAGRVLVADRFLGALTIDAATPPYYLETGQALRSRDRTLRRPRFPARDGQPRGDDLGPGQGRHGPDRCRSGRVPAAGHATPVRTAGRTGRATPKPCCARGLSSAGRPVTAMRRRLPSSPPPSISNDWTSSTGSSSRR